MKLAATFSLAVIAIAIGWISFARGEPATTQTVSRFQVRLVDDKDANAEKLPSFDGNEAPTPVAKHIELSDADLESASPYSQTNEPAVEIRFNDDGSVKLRTLTKEHLNQRLAFIFDGKVLCAPTIKSEIGRSGVITLGQNATREDAQTLAKTINQAIDDRPATSQPSP